MNPLWSRKMAVLWLWIILHHYMLICHFYMKRWWEIIEIKIIIIVVVPFLSSCSYIFIIEIYDKSNQKDSLFVSLSLDDRLNHPLAQDLPLGTSFWSHNPIYHKISSKIQRFKMKWNSNIDKHHRFPSWIWSHKPWGRRGRGGWLDKHNTPPRPEWRHQHQGSHPTPMLTKKEKDRERLIKLILDD